MMYETVDLNIIPVGEMPVVHCSQYDTNRLIRFVLTDGNDPFTFGGLVSVTTTIRKVDGTLWKYEDTAPVIVSSRYEIATDEQMTACAGNNYGELTIKYRDPDVSEDEIKISTLNFILKVELSPETGGLVSQSEINNLDSQIALIVDQQLSNYYTKDEINDQIETIVSEQVTPIVSSIVSEQVPPIVQSELGNYYTKTETDTYFYNKSETDTLLDGKANTSDLPDMDDYYTKTDTDTLLSGKVSNSTLNNYYTKPEVDALVGTFDIIDTASGAIATFNDGGDNIPLKSCEVAIVAQQASGTPSPSNPLPITGFSSIDISVSNGVDTPTVHTVPLGQTIYGGTAELVNGNGSKTWGYIEFDGSADESWNLHPSIANLFYIDNALPNAYHGDGTETGYAICNTYEQSNYNPLSSLSNNKFAIGYPNVLRLAVKNTACADVTAFKTALSSTPMQIAYTLDTPTEFTFTPESIPTLSGLNNIYSNCGDVAVEYFNDKANQLVTLYNVLGGI